MRIKKSWHLVFNLCITLPARRSMQNTQFIYKYTTINQYSSATVIPVFSHTTFTKRVQQFLTSKFIKKLRMKNYLRWMPTHNVTRKLRRSRTQQMNKKKNTEKILIAVESQFNILQNKNYITKEDLLLLFMCSINAISTSRTFANVTSSPYMSIYVTHNLYHYKYTLL